VGACLFALGPALARADVVRLKNGNEIKGTVVEDTPERVVIETGSGRLTFKRNLVEKVEKTAPKEPKPAPAEPSPREPGPPPAKKTPDTAGAPEPGVPGGPPARAPLKAVRVPGVRGLVEPSVYALHGSLAARGERWVFARRWNRLPPRSLTGFESVLLLASGSEAPPDGEQPLEVLRLGMEVVEYRVPGDRSGKDKREWKITRAAYARPEQWHKDKPDAKFSRETLSVSGRQFGCLVFERTAKKQDGGTRRERHWLHVDPDGMQLFPGEVKTEIDGVVVSELVRIEPPAAALPRLPDLSGVQVGQRLVWRERSGKEAVHVVSRIVPDEVELENAAGEGFVRTWRWDPKPLASRDGKPLARETLTVGGQAFSCLITELPGFIPFRYWHHAGEDGVVRFPGTIKSLAQRAGQWEVADELLRIEPPPPR
jgi:hypothetical protein